MGNKYFQDSEIQGLVPELVDKLTSARIVADVPFMITSGYRTCAANTNALGVEGSSHLVGKAVDLHVEDSTSRFEIVKGLLAAGFNRIGLYATDKHIHADIDETKPQNVIWVNP